MYWKSSRLINWNQTHETSGYHYFQCTLKVFNNLLSEVTGGTNNRRCVCFSFLNPQISGVERVLKPPQPSPPLCVQMDFTRTFEANNKCNKIKYFWSHFFQIFAVLKYHRRLWSNIFNTDIFRCINTHIKGAYYRIWPFLGYLCS